MISRKHKIKLNSTHFDTPVTPVSILSFILKRKLNSYSRVEMLEIIRALVLQFI